MKFNFLTIIFGVVFCIFVFLLYLKLDHSYQTLAFFGLALWFVVKALTADRVENSLKEIKESVSNLNESRNQLLILEEGIKEIYNIHAKGKMSDVEEKCLDLLEKNDPVFVREEREEKAGNNAENEETDESEPTE